MCDNLKPCLCSNFCSINSGCILNHHLLTNHSKTELYGTLKLLPEGKKREREIISLLQLKQPPKVNRRQIDHHWALKVHQGIDLDRDYVSKSERLYHESLNTRCHTEFFNNYGKEMKML